MWCTFIRLGVKRDLILYKQHSKYIPIFFLVTGSTEQKSSIYSHFFHQTFK
jgi:hypothetical protein